MVLMPGVIEYPRKMQEVACNCPAISQARGLSAPQKREIIDRRPRLYRSGRWAVSRSREVAFRLGPYDRSKPLVIDPVLSFSTYLGGSGGDTVHGIAVDPQGNAYIAGGTFSLDFPVASNGFQETCGN